MVGDVEEVDLQVQVNGWSLPQLENFAVIAEEQFLRKDICTMINGSDFVSTHATHPFEDEVIGLENDDRNAEADQRQAGREQKEKACK